MRQPGKGAKPLRHRAGAVGRQRIELGADAGAAEHGRALLRIGHGAVAAEQGGHVDAKACIANPARETGNVGADARHLGHDDDRRTLARHVNRLCRALQRDDAPVEIG